RSRPGVRADQPPSRATRERERVPRGGDQTHPQLWHHGGKEPDASGSRSAGGDRSPDEFHGSDLRGDWYRQGVAGTRDSREERAKGQTLWARELRGRAAGPRRKRTLRPRTRGVHRCEPTPAGTV